MTKEEAIKVLKNPPRVYDEEMWAALDMAIEVRKYMILQVYSRFAEWLKELKRLRSEASWRRSDGN